MKFNKLISASLSAVLIFSMSACSCAGGGTNGGNENSAQLIAAASKINKDAVFKRTGETPVAGCDYIEDIKCFNGSFYMASSEYIYPEDPADGFTGDSEFSPTPIVYNEGMEPAVKEGEDADTTEENGSEENEEEQDKLSDIDESLISANPDVYEPGENMDFQAPKVYLHVYSFTDVSDISESVIEMEQDAYYNGKFCVDKDENLYVTVTKYDEETFREGVYLYKYDKNNVKTAEVCVNDGGGESWYWMTGLNCDDNGNIYVQDESGLTIFDSNLNSVAKVEKADENEYYQNLCRMNDGSIAIQVSLWSEDKTETRIDKVSADGSVEKLTAGDIIKDNEIIQGSGCDFYYRTSTSVYGFNEGEQTSKEIVNFYDSDIAPDELGMFYFENPDRFITVEYSDNGGVVLVTYDKVPADQVVEKEVVTIGAVYLDYNIQRQIMNFNRQSDTVKIKLVDYSTFNTNDDWGAGERRLNSDIASGNAPDIISSSSYEVLNLMKKGVFADLTPYMEKGNGIKKSDLVANAQTIYADGDKLYCIYPSFTVECCSMNKNNYKEGMTLEDIMQWEQTTGYKALGDSTIASTVMYYGMNYGINKYMDPGTGKCMFDSQEFIDLLEYAKTYPLEIPDDYYENYTYETYINNFKQNKQLMEITYLYGFRDAYRENYIKMGDDYIICGLPLGDIEGAALTPNGLLGINAKCKNKEAAWEFISSCFTKEFHEMDNWGFSSVESIMDEQIAEAKDRPYYLDENGDKEYYDDSYWFGEEEVIVPTMPEEKAQELKQFVTNVKTVQFYDEGIENIIDEETQPFFAGQKTAKDVASVIQSRVQIFVNERK